VLLNGRLEKKKHIEMMIQSRLNERVANLMVEVVDKDGYQRKCTTVLGQLALLV